MDILMYVFITILLFSIESVYFVLAKRFNIIDKPNKRSSHSKITLRGGGIIFFITALLYFVLGGFHYCWFLLGLTLISIISFYDDIYSVSSKLRLVFQILAVFLIFFQLDILFQYPVIILFLGLLICVGVINIYNFMDGINGMTGGYSLAVLLPLIYVNYNIIEFVDVKFLYYILLSLLVFNFFNFRKKAKCFAGDVGSVSIAFIFLFLLGLLIKVSYNFTFLIFLVVYGVDGVLTIFHRLWLRENILQAHRMHLYQILSNELKIPHIYVSFIYLVLQLLISLGMFIIPINQWLYMILVVFILSLVYIFFILKYFRLHKINQ